MEYLAAIIPSIGVGALFFFAMRAIFRADHRERDALAEAEQEYDAQQAPQAETQGESR